jgi:transcriptional regulator with GAF, ATPase, and Fis domain
LVTQTPSKRKSAANNLPVLPLLGHSAAMQRIAGLLDRVSRYKTNVLLLGESGTGKDLLARTIHARGPRRAARFEPQNCATLSHELLESELFGHERGAFTGATRRRRAVRAATRFAEPMTANGSATARPRMEAEWEGKATSNGTARH